MAAVIPLKERNKIEKLQKELRSLSLLEEDEFIKEGFYPVRIGSFFYYGFLTPRQLILGIKGPHGSQKKQSDLIPFTTIKEISMKNDRNRQALVSLILSSVVLPILLFLFYLMKFSFYGFNPQFDLFSWIIFLAGCIILPIALVQSLYRFVKGEPSITLLVPGMPLKIGPKYGLFLRLSPLYFFTLTGTEVHSEGTKGGFEELYQLLQTYSKV